MRYFIVFALLFCACNPTKQISRICKRNPEVCKAQKDSVIYRDTVITDTVKVAIQGDYILFDSPCDSVFPNDTVIVKKQGHLSAIVEHKSGKVTFKCKEDSLIFVNTILQIKLDSISKTIIKNNGIALQNKCDHEATTFDIICYTTFIILCMALIVWIVSKFYGV